MSEPVLCNYCEVDDATVVFGPGVAQISQIVRCNRCGLMYASPRAKQPDHVEIAGYDPNFDGLPPGNPREIKEKIQVRDYDDTRALLNRMYPQRGRLLEIGSGLGFLLEAFRKDGWDAVGLEPSYYCCRYARERLGLEVVNGILDTADLREESFDVVLMNHVIEHLDDPLKTLRDVNRLLKPDGHFVIETPRYDTLTFKLLGKRERSINCGGHIYFFTTQTLKNFYEAAGFRSVDLSYVGRTLTMGRLLYNVGVISKSKAVAESLSKVSKSLRLDGLRIRLNFRDMQRVCVAKVAAARDASRTPVEWLPASPS